jgi:hypothetical protein
MTHRDLGVIESKRQPGRIWRSYGPPRIVWSAPAPTTGPRK